jgi:putative CocE/NonD family hydrolase
MKFRQPVRMRDGGDLLHDLYLPEGEQPLPMLWMRTPYPSTTPIFVQLARHLASGGFAVMVQNVRGRAGSSGQLDFEAEGQDACDTLLWVREQPWFNGDVGLFGSSYQTYLAYTAISQPLPAGVRVKAMVAMAGLFDPREIARGGVIPLHWALPWALMLRQSTSSSDRRRSAADWLKVLEHLPLETAVVGDDFSGVFWRHIRQPECFGEMPWSELAVVPTLHITGWFDFLLDSQIDKYLFMRDTVQRRGLTERHRLIIGPWDHQSLWHPFQRRLVAWTPPEDNEFGAGTDYDLLAELGRWFDHYMKGAEMSVESGTTYFAMRENRWHGASAWPPPGGRPHSLYLAPRQLLPEPPAPGASESYEYDPHNPPPTLGGCIWPWTNEMQPGPTDQSPLHNRTDLLVYASAPLTADLDVAGQVTVECEVATTGPDTDFTAKLLELTPEGKALYVHDGICRLSAHPEFGQVLPDVPMQIRIDAGHTAYRFRKGHRIGLEISSSSFPKWDRNRNALAGAPGDAVAQAHQTVFYGASRLCLTVVDV